MRGIDLEGPSRPLTPAEVSDWLSPSWPSPKSRLVGVAPLMTGVKPSELAHLHPDWRRWKDDMLYLRIPPESPCHGGVDGDPCRDCQRERDGRWTPHLQPRQVPVYDGQFQQLLDAYFSLHGNDLTLRAVNELSLKVRENHLSHRDFSNRALRFTFLIALLAKGFEPDKVQTIMGYSSRKQIQAMQNVASEDRYEGLERLGTGEFRD